MGFFRPVVFLKCDGRGLHCDFPQIAMHPEDQIFSLFVVREPAGEFEISPAEFVRAINIE